PMERPHDSDQDGETQEEPDDRREHDEHGDLSEAVGDERAPPGLGYRGPAHASDEGMRRGGWKPEEPGDHVPNDRPDQSGEDDCGREDHRLHDVLGYRCRDYCP